MSETKEKKESVKYRFGQNDIDLDHYIYNLGNNVQSYVDSQNWNDGQKQEFMDSYNRFMQEFQNQLNNNTNRFSTNDFGAILDSMGEFNNTDIDSDSGDYYYNSDGKQVNAKEYNNLKKRQQKRYNTFSANRAVAQYFNKVGKAILKSGNSKGREKEKFNINKHGFLADWQKRNSVSGEKIDLKPYLNMDAFDTTTKKRARTNRLKYLSDEIQNYLNNFNDDDYNYEGSSFASGSEYRAALERLKNHLNDGYWTNDDMILANQAGIGGSFYNNFFSEDENPEITPEQKKAQEKEAQEKLRQDAWKSEVKRRYNIYKQSQKPWEIDRPYYINVGNDYLGENGTWDIQKWRDSFKEGTPYYDMIATGKREGLASYINEVLKNPYTPEFNRMMQYLINDGGLKPLSDGRYYIRQDSDNTTQSALIYDPARGALYKTFLGDIASEWDIVKNKFLQNYNSDDGLERYYKNGGMIEKHQLGGSMTANYENSIRQSLNKRAAENNKSAEEQAADERKIGTIYSGAEATAANPNTGFTDIEYARIGSAIADIGSAITAFVPGAGTVASAVTGVGSTLMNAYADMRDDGVSGWQAFKNFGMNLGMDIAGLIPGGGFAAKTAKIIKSISSIIPKVALTLGAISAFNNKDGIMESLNKAIDKPSDMTVQDWQNIAQALSLIGGGSTVAGAAYGKKARNNKQALSDATNKDKIAIDVVQNGNKKTVLFTGDDAKNIRTARENNDIDVVNNILKKYENTKDATIATGSDYGFKKPTKWYKPVNFGDTGKGKMAIYDIVSDTKGSYIQRGNWTGDTRLTRANMPEIYGRSNQTVAAVDAAVANTRKNILDGFNTSSNKRKASSDRLNSEVNATQSKIDNLNTQLGGRKSSDIQRQIDNINSNRGADWAIRKQNYDDLVNVRANKQKQLDDNLKDSSTYPLTKKEKTKLQQEISDLDARINAEKPFIEANSDAKLTALQNQLNTVSNFEKDLKYNTNRLTKLRQYQQNLTNTRSNYYNNFVASHTNADGKISWTNPHGRAATEMTKDDFDEILRQAGIMFKKGGSLNISKVRRFQSGKNIIRNTKSSADWYSDMFNSPEMQQWINSFTTGEYNNYEQFNELQKSWANNKKDTGYSPQTAQVSYNQGVYDRQGKWNNTKTNAAIQRAVDSGKITTYGKSGDNASGNYQDGYFGEQEFLRHGGTKESWQGREQELAKFQNLLKEKGLTYTLDENSGMYLMGKIKEAPKSVQKPATPESKTPEFRTTEVTPEGSNNGSDDDEINNQKYNLFQFKKDPTLLYGLPRAYAADRSNRRITDLAKSAEIPLLQNPFEIHRTVKGDLNSIMQGQKAAALLNNAANRPLTSDGQALMAARLEAQNKGLEYINAGLAKDNDAFNTSKEEAWQQQKENAKNRHNVAAVNNESLYKAESNKNKYEQAYLSKKHNIWDTFAQQLEYDERTKQSENKTYKDYFAKQDIHNAFTYDLENQAKKSGVVLTPEQIEVWNKVVSGTNVSTLSKEDKQKYLDVAKIAQQLENQALREYYNVGNTRWTNLRRFSTNKPQQSDNITITERKNGGKIIVAGIKAKTADAERFQKSIKASIDRHEKILDRLSKGLYKQVNTLIIK